MPGVRSITDEERNYYLHVGTTLKRCRKIRGLTLKQASKISGVGWRLIQKYECASNRIMLPKLARLADAYNYPIGWFLPTSYSAFKERYPCPPSLQSKSP